MKDLAIGKMIRQYRKNKGLTQKELGDLISVSDVMIGQYERGIRNPKLDQIKKIADALGVNINTLIGTPNKSSWDHKDFFLLEDRLKKIGYSLGAYAEDAYAWINYPDGTLEITESDLEEIDRSINVFLKYKLEEFKQQRIKDFRKNN